MSELINLLKLTRAKHGLQLGPTKLTKTYNYYAKWVRIIIMQNGYVDYLNMKCNINFKANHNVFSSITFILKCL